MEALLNIFLAIFVGAWFGGFATSALFRLPRRIPLNGYDEHNGQKPHCSSCKHPLTPKEFYPIIGWLLCKGKCNYCGISISKLYPAVECVIAFLSLHLFLHYGFGERYFLLLGSYVCLILIVAIDFEHKNIMPQTLWALLFIGSIYRTLNDHCLYPFFFGSMLALCIGYLILKIISHFTSIAIRKDVMMLIAVGGVHLPVHTWPYYAVIYASLAVMHGVFNTYKKERIFILRYSIIAEVSFLVVLLTTSLPMFTSPMCDIY